MLCVLSVSIQTEYFRWIQNDERPKEINVSAVCTWNANKAKIVIRVFALDEDFVCTINLSEWINNWITMRWKRKRLRRCWLLTTFFYPCSVFGCVRPRYIDPVEQFFFWLGSQSIDSGNFDWRMAELAKLWQNMIMSNHLIECSGHHWHSVNIKVWN